MDYGYPPESPRSDFPLGDYLWNCLFARDSDVFDRDCNATPSADWSKTGFVDRVNANADLLAVWRVQLVVSS